MANEDGTTVDGAAAGGEGAGGAPAGAAAAAAAGAPAAGAAAPAAAPAAARPAGGGGGGAKITLSSDEFAKRIQREARALIRRKVGTDDLEEVAALVERGKKTPAAVAAPAAGAPAAVAGPDPELEKLRAQIREKDAALEEEKSRRRRVKARAREEAMDMRLRHSALSAGIVGDNVDYALDRYKKAVRTAPEGKAPMPDAYWTEMRKTQPFLFGAAAAAPAPVAVRGTTAPPEGAANGEAPRPAASGAPRVDRKIEEMNDKEFEDRTANRYGFRPPRVA